MLFYTLPFFTYLTFVNALAAFSLLLNTPPTIENFHNNYIFYWLVNMVAVVHLFNEKQKQMDVTQFF